VVWKEWELRGSVTVLKLRLFCGLSPKKAKTKLNRSVAKGQANTLNIVQS
jgi:hypothetical protein